MSIPSLVALPGLTPGLQVSDALRSHLAGIDAATVGFVDGVELIQDAERAGGPALPALVSALDRALSALGAERSILVAESFSATSALAYAAAHPDRVSELVLSAPLGYSSPLTAGQRRGVSLADGIRGLFSSDPDRVEAAVEQLVGDASDVPALAKAYLAAYDEPVSSSAATLATWVENRSLDLTGQPDGDGVRSVKAQVSLVWGRDDVAAGLDSGFYLTRRLRNVGLRVFPSAGHLTSVERPTELARHIRSVTGSATSRVEAAE